ncbi:hypothetical protein PF003_g25812 [Phytophthora fragariae]|nr:hypothetical protein PF003_g25812 [Phytophthora fragariae]
MVALRARVQDAEARLERLQNVRRDLDFLRGVSDLTGAPETLPRRFHRQEFFVVDRVVLFHCLQLARLEIHYPLSAFGIHLQQATANGTVGCIAYHSERPLLISAVGSTKLRPRFVGSFTVIGGHGHTYTLDLPSSMATYPTFYVGLLKTNRPAGAVEPEEPTGSQNIVGRPSPSSEQALPREVGQEQEPEKEHEPLSGVPLGPPS